MKILTETIAHKELVMLTCHKTGEDPFALLAAGTLLPKVRKIMEGPLEFDDFDDFSRRYIMPAL